MTRREVMYYKCNVCGFEDTGKAVHHYEFLDPSDYQAGFGDKEIEDICDDCKVKLLELSGEKNMCWRALRFVKKLKEISGGENANES